MLIKYTITIKDYYNRKTTKTFVFPDSDVSVTRTAMFDLVQDLDALIDGAIVSVQETCYLPLGGIKSQPNERANVDEALIFVGELNDPRRTLYPLRVPTGRLDLASPDGSVDLTQTVVRAFLDDFTGLAHVPVSDGEQVREFVMGKVEK